MNQVKSIVFFLMMANVVLGQTNVYDSISFGGRWRTFMTHLPKGYDVSKKYPLVLAFHGGSPLGYQSIQYQSRLSEKSDTAGFIVVYPEGVKVAGNRTWNAGGCCAPATTLNIDDVGFVNSLLNTLFRSRPVDTTRVYATGFSNGALLSYKLANQLTNRFAAVAIVEGSFVSYPWRPSRSVPIISFHSYQDQNIKYYGGVTTGATGTYFPPQDSMFSVISSNYACVVKKEILFQNINKYDHFRYSNCLCNSVIEQYVSYDGEHSWAGGLATGGTTVSNQFSATYLMWKFFQNYTTSCGSVNGLIENEDQRETLQLYPNPTDGFLTAYLAVDEYDVIVFNQIGEVVKVHHATKEQKQLNCAELPKGLYLIQIKTAKNTMTQKFIKY
jgi:polyhydroxybutyrate depolymerase